MANATSKDVIDSLIGLAADTIKYVTTINVPLSVQNQLTRSISSIGANFAEAQDASSKKDFINKIYIAKKEASESIYWLKLTSRLTSHNQENDLLQDRTQRFIMMLQKIINTSRSSS